MENTIIAKKYQIENKELAKATKEIVKATESAAKSLLKIASIMADVDERRLYADDFKSIVEYGECVFGYKKSAIYNMVRIGRDYIDVVSGKSVLALENGDDFTFNQLTRLLPLPSVNAAEELVSEKVITPDMTLKEIERVVKKYNAPDETEQEETTQQEETETTQQEETETAQQEETAEQEEIAMNFMAANSAIERLIELLKEHPDHFSLLTNIKNAMEYIENTLK